MAACIACIVVPTYHMTNVNFTKAAFQYRYGDKKYSEVLINGVLQEHVHCSHKGAAIFESQVRSCEDPPTFKVGNSPQECSENLEDGNSDLWLGKEQIIKPDCRVHQPKSKCKIFPFKLSWNADSTWLLFIFALNVFWCVKGVEVASGRCF